MNSMGILSRSLFIRLILQSEVTAPSFESCILPCPSGGDIEFA